VRRLTPKECERLRAFPDDWTRWRLTDGVLVEQSDSTRYRQIGNAVTTTVPEWIVRRIVAVSAALSATEAAA
jgi:DNA (cytosine-5)-methyltransferase 1